MYDYEGLCAGLLRRSAQGYVCRTVEVYYFGGTKFSEFGLRFGGTFPNFNSHPQLGPPLHSGRGLAVYMIELGCLIPSHPQPGPPRPRASLTIHNTTQKHNSLVSSARPFGPPYVCSDASEALYT